MRAKRFVCVLLFVVLSGCMLVSGSVLGSAWLPVRVPGAWETNAPQSAAGYDGIAWYRTWVKPHDSFFARHERNLFEESVTINLRNVADAHEVFVNGKRIGAGGQFPPKFSSGKEALHRHKVPPGTLRKGEWNEIAIRIYNRSGPGGFLGEAPFIMNYFMECVLEGPWLFRLGDGPDWTSGPRADKPSASAFDQFRESSGVLGETSETVPGPRLPPAESLASMNTAEDLAVDLLLHEPLVTQPVHVSFDARGRLWVSQYRQYPYPAGLKMISRDKYYRAHYDRIPPAPPNHDRGRDLISIHEDTDGDGKYDRHKVFQESLNLANAALPGRGGVWVMHTPYLLFYPDADSDDVPDGPPIVHLAGFGFEDTHSIANGLVWGMDGWLYGGQGSTTSSRVVRPGIDPPDAPGVAFEGCMVWRYHPDTREYEIYAEGSGNTFGLEIDADGRLFSGHNGGTTRGWHYVQGGYYLKQAFDPGKFGPPRNPYAFGELSMLKSENAVKRFSHLAAVVEGTALPESYADMFFSLDPLHNVVIASNRDKLGSTFSTRDVQNVLESSDPAFRPVYIVNAPDGSLVIADFYEYYIAHGQHYQSHIDRTTGRIYRLRGRDSSLATDLNLISKSTDELIDLLNHPNKWHRHTAVRIIGERKEPSAYPRLKRLVANPTGSAALGALWALHQSGGLDESTALGALQHSHPPVRMWAVRLLGDPKRVSTQAASALARLAETESNPEVRSQLAATARRLPMPDALLIAAGLLKRDEDLQDPFIPHLLWWVLETQLTTAHDAVVAWLETQQLWDEPLFFEHMLPRIMRRLAAEGRQQTLLSAARLLRAAPSPRHAEQLLKGFEAAYHGRPITGLPDELVAALDATGKAPLIIQARRGDPAAVRLALQTMQDRNAPPQERLALAKFFGEVPYPEAERILLNLALDAAASVELRKIALVALGSYSSEAAGQQIAGALPHLPEALRTPALALLASRPGWSLELLRQLESNRIDRTSIPPDLIDRMRTHNSDGIERFLAKLFPATDQRQTANWRGRSEELRVVLAQGTGNPYTGELLYAERCAGCHKLFFKGGDIGPDLTHYQRDNLGTMVLSIVDPNAEIREGYEYHIIQTTDGRTLSGFIVDRNEQITVLRGLEGDNLTLRQSEIRTLEPMGRSLMPEGLLDGLTDQELRDLFAYLRISQPITR